MGAAYLPRNIAALAVGGRLVVIGLQGGASGELDLGTMLRHRLTVHAASLRARPVAEKATVVEAVRDQVWPLIASGQVAQITYHLNKAMDNGLTQAQAGEVLTHLAFYVGWPNVFSALPVAKDVFEKRPH